MLYRPIFFGFLLFYFLMPPNTVYAQIATECAGVEIPADYDEDKQQAHLNNYFAAGFIMTPMTPIQPFQKDELQGRWCCLWRSSD